MTVGIVKRRALYFFTAIMNSEIVSLSISARMNKETVIFLYADEK